MDAPPYRARLDGQVNPDYPQQLSRGLVLVKWRLLALPQYLIVAIFAGGWGFGWNAAGRITGGRS